MISKLHGPRCISTFRLPRQNLGGHCSLDCGSEHPLRLHAMSRRYKKNRRNSGCARWHFIMCESLRNRQFAIESTSSSLTECFQPLFQLRFRRQTPAMPLGHFWSAPPKGWAASRDITGSRQYNAKQLACIFDARWIESAEQFALRRSRIPWGTSPIGSAEFENA